MIRIYMKRLFLAIAFSLISLSSFAQEKSTMFNGATNLQVFYDFGKDRGIVTTTLEGFYSDPWGNTFFFIDYDHGMGSTHPNGTYMEIARCFNFWQDTALAPLSLQAEYNGGVYRSFGVNHAFLAGVDWFVHSSDFKNLFNFKLLYKHIFYGDPAVKSKAPLQFTFVWGMDDLFGVKGLRFSGFADVWAEEHTLLTAADGRALATPEKSSFVFISEPQLWYCVGQHFGCPNLNVGGEIELSWDFGTCKGFWCRPCAGIKWVF